MKVWELFAENKSYREAHLLTWIGMPVEVICEFRPIRECEGRLTGILHPPLQILKSCADSFGAKVVKRVEPRILGMCFRVPVIEGSPLIF